jgi:hypothetical protein
LIRSITVPISDGATLVLSFEVPTCGDGFGHYLKSNVARCVFVWAMADIVLGLSKFIVILLSSASVLI